MLTFHGKWSYRNGGIAGCSIMQQSSHCLEHLRCFGSVRPDASRFDGEPSGIVLRSRTLSLKRRPSCGEGLFLLNNLSALLCYLIVASWKGYLAGHQSADAARVRLALVQLAFLNRLLQDRQYCKVQLWTAYSSPTIRYVLHRARWDWDPSGLSF